MTEDLPPDIARLARRYSRDLGQIVPSDSLDARIARSVAAANENASAGVTRAPARRWQRPFAWAAAACLAVLAISAGIIIGMRLERASKIAAVDALARQAGQQVAWSPEDLGMWPSDSVALTIPAEYSPQGTLVAVKPNDKSNGQRFWIDVVVSNDGTVRIDRIVPAERAARHEQVNPNGVTLQIQ
jgi:hypothetical protein